IVKIWVFAHAVAQIGIAFAAIAEARAQFTGFGVQRPQAGLLVGGNDAGITHAIARFVFFSDFIIAYTAAAVPAGAEFGFGIERPALFPGFRIQGDDFVLWCAQIKRIAHLDRRSLVFVGFAGLRAGTIGPGHFQLAYIVRLDL